MLKLLFFRFFFNSATYSFVDNRVIIESINVIFHKNKFFVNLRNSRTQEYHLSSNSSTSSFINEDPIDLNLKEIK